MHASMTGADHDHTGRLISCLHPSGTDVKDMPLYEFTTLPPAYLPSDSRQLLKVHVRPPRPTTLWDDPERQALERNASGNNVSSSIVISTDSSKELICHSREALVKPLKRNLCLQHPRTPFPSVTLNQSSRTQPVPNLWTLPGLWSLPRSNPSGKLLAGNSGTFQCVPS